jgi:translin
MKNLDGIANSIQARLDEKDTVREIAIKSSRAIIRLSGSVVHSIHKGEDISGMMAEATDEAQRLRSVLVDHQEIWYSGLVEDAMQELSEAAILIAIVRQEDLPTPEELGIQPTAYLLGLADCIGELRRFTLEALRNGEMERANSSLDMMEEMFRVLMRFDYPDALVSIRRKQDIARSLLEKTRGEVAVAMSSKLLADRITALQERLDRVK